MASTHRLAIVLEEEALLELQQVLLDQDGLGALDFLQKHIAGRIPAKGTAPCDSTRLNPYLLRDDLKPRS